MPFHSQILSTLKNLPLDGKLQGLQVTDSGMVSFILQVEPQAVKEGLNLKEQAEGLLKKIPGVTDVKIVVTSQRKSQKTEIPSVKHIVAIASGKGGVGKSTTAVNLACALQQMGLRVGILDGDIYGPSLPRLLGIDKKPTSDDGKIMNPLEAYGLKCMSMGFLIDEKTPAIWRGPMVQSALQQMLRQVKWGELDILIIDMPPGTGDVHLTLTQTVQLSGAIIVSTPQDLALLDARKALEMFVKMDVPILGLVENMSFFLCPHCEGRSDIFEHGGVYRQAHALDLPVLAEIPLQIAIRETSDAGTPITCSLPSSPEAILYQKLAEQVLSIICSKK